MLHNNPLLRFSFILLNDPNTIVTEAAQIFNKIFEALKIFLL
ncbi:hypothetical protein CLOSTASPAR_01951 [[Clostridium] asparagiforme DSM 15981]|uniref:Uncharacterized protein n=1 Tax=[Clostridium] asparagiforme DSM 15981 TaxID=518636 RepID=C0CY76_9FIRM|nr:hypothetical protein CLOSTASPAR_01951 [[Clostridium] asparagiforme DSM 15981]